MALRNTRYQHWDGRHQNIWSRRAVIAQQGLKSCLQSRHMKYLITLCWAICFTQASVLFFLGQLLVSDSVLYKWLDHLGPQLQTFANSLVKWLETHPEISVHCTQNILFYYFDSPLRTFTFIAIALAIPHLITRDLSSKAIVIYASKAVSRFDYFLGKWATLMGVMILTWLGPVCVAWFVGNLLAPNWSFFWHSRTALGNTLLYTVSSMMILSLIGLGVSAAATKEKSAVGLWIIIWLVGNAFVAIGQATKPWLKHLSLSHDLDQLALAIFKLTDHIDLAKENIPVLGSMLRVPREVYARWDHPELAGASLAMALMAALAIIILNARLKPE